VRPAGTVFAAFVDGAGRVLRAPAVLVGAWLATLALAAPLALALRQAIATHLGASLAAESMVRGVNWDWWQEFTHQAAGLGTTFTPGIVGFAAVLRNLGHLADATPLGAAIAGSLALWLVAWTFLSGGIMDRYARQRRTFAHGFFSACGAHAFRLLRLGAIALLFYGALFLVVHGWLFDRLYPSLTRDLTVERTAFLVRVTLYALFVVLLVAVNLLVDYARVRIVVEDRRSAIGALLAAARFIRRHPGGVIGVYLLVAVAWMIVTAAYALVAPGATAPALVALLVGQIYILARLATKLWFYAAQIAFFQGRLAHARYVAAPAAPWPDPPVAEALAPPVTGP
jgi:hypothetical protein